MPRLLRSAPAAALLVASLSAGGAAASQEAAPNGAADATIDLASADGVRLVDAQWRYSDVRILETEFRSVGSDLKPSGPRNRTYDFEPHAGSVDFDDTGWEVLDPAALTARRGNGRLSFNWYRLKLTVPPRIGAFDPTGSTAVFDIVVDDYAEVWVDGELPRELGGGNLNLVRGWNAPNRLIVGRNVRPGQQIQLAVFGINGPISDPPANYIWVRSARLEFYREPHAVRPTRVPASLTRHDAGIDAIVPGELLVEQLAEGFQFTEGPVWHPDGYLLFSDPNANRIYRWASPDSLSVYRAESGYSGADLSAYHQPGSNGLALDRQRRLTIDEHGNRRVTRLAPDGTLIVLADRYQGKRLNSPNDLVYRADGSLYFTDPPFGLPRVYDDPAKELPYSGVFRYADGRLELLDASLKGPNGIAFSPDERYLYVGNWDEQRKVVMRYAVRPDGGVGPGEVFLDLTAEPGEEAIDGVKVDRQGNLYVSGPGGLWIVAPDGRPLGTLVLPELPANFAWGDADGRTLYLTARTGLYRVRLNVPGAGVRRDGEAARGTRGGRAS